MRIEQWVSLLSVLVDGVIAWQTIASSVVSSSMTTARLVLFAVTALFALVAAPLWKATNYFPPAIMP